MHLSIIKYNILKFHTVFHVRELCFGSWSGHEIFLSFLLFFHVTTKKRGRRHIHRCIFFSKSLDKLWKRKDPGRQKTKCHLTFIYLSGPHDISILFQHSLIYLIFSSLSTQIPRIYIINLLNNPFSSMNTSFSACSTFHFFLGTNSYHTNHSFADHGYFYPRSHRW